MYSHTYLSGNLALDIINDNDVYNADDLIDVHVFRDNLRITANDQAFYETVRNDRVVLYAARSDKELYALLADDHDGRVYETFD